MNVHARQLLQDVKTYIEEMEARIDGEWGSTRDFDKILEDGDEPEIYRRIVAALAEEVDADG